MVGTFDGVEEPTFSYVNNLVTPAQKGFFGQWTNHETSDLLITYHYGGSVKVRDPRSPRQNDQTAVKPRLFVAQSPIGTFGWVLMLKLTDRSVVTTRIRVFNGDI